MKSFREISNRLRHFHKVKPTFAFTNTYKQGVNVAYLAANTHNTFGYKQKSRPFSRKGGV